MFITKSEYDVLKTSINQTFNDCKENSTATLYVKQKDVTSFITIEKKYAEVRCDLTGKIIKKRKWNNETKAAAISLLAQHKISKKGWYILMLIMMIPVSGLIYTMYDMVSSSNSYNASFSSKTDKEQDELLLELGKGDYIKTSNFVYKINLINKNNITVLKGKNPVKKPYEPIDENQIFNTPPIKINSDAFYKKHIIQHGNNMELIFQTLNK